jgi:hypothetical protein
MFLTMGYKTMTDIERQRIERHLQEIDAWRASGLAVTVFAQQCGQTVQAWRGKLSWEKRWRNMLQGIPLNYRTHNEVAHAFVKATVPALPGFPPNFSVTSHIRVTLQSKTGGALLAHIDWPSDQTQKCGLWLREVLA